MHVEKKWWLFFWIAWKGRITQELDYLYALYILVQIPRHGGQAIQGFDILLSSQRPSEPLLCVFYPFRQQ